MLRAIDKHVAQFKLAVLKLDIQKVPWETVVENAVLRLPPFQAGDKEKGFRDAMILECLVQLVKSSPVRLRKTCRIALVTSDGLLQEAAKKRLAGRGNVRILGSNEELSSLINTVASSVTEEYVAPLKKTAHALFYTRGNKDSLYIKYDVFSAIKTKISDHSKSLPAEADTIEVDKINITATGFLRKQRQRVFWSTRLRITVKALKKMFKDSLVLPKQPDLGMLPINPVYAGSI